MEIMPFLPERPEKAPEDSSPRGLTSVVSTILSSPDQIAEDFAARGFSEGTLEEDGSINVDLEISEEFNDLVVPDLDIQGLDSDTDDLN